jgi:hypothetical protein
MRRQEGLIHIHLLFSMRKNIQTAHHLHKGTLPVQNLSQIIMQDLQEHEEVLKHVSIHVTPE